MIRRKIMNDKHQENNALTGPLIFTPPASSFIIVLGFDLLGARAARQLSPQKRVVGTI
jgi:hypothetical protein